MENKVKNMFIGIALGDSLGMPVETFSSQKIAKLYPDGIKGFVSTEESEFFRGCAPGTCTDDTYLSIAVANALILSNGFDMDAMAQEHIAAFKDPRGWGTTTKEAVQRLRDGVRWDKSASLSQGKKIRGVGNGVPMKIAPLAAYHYLNDVDWKRAIAECVTFTKMTHSTSIAISTSLAHSFAIKYCLSKNKDSFNPDEFVEGLIDESKKGQTIYPLRHGEDDVVSQFEKLKKWKNLTPNKIETLFGSGSHYLFHSLPFTYAHFILNFNGDDGLLKLVNAGGDTDTNASMAGAMMGALGGNFKDNLVDKIGCIGVLLGVVEKYTNAFCKGTKHG